MILISETKRFTEKYIKQSILDNPELFSNLGKLDPSRVVFEKSVSFGNLRTDCIIFTETVGLIGVEIKTKYDNLRRLKRQLSNYQRVCNYTYVYCEDSQLAGVLKLIKDNHWEHYIGVIAYTVFEDEVIPGVYQQAYPSPKWTLTTAMQMMWKSEVRDMLKAYTSRKALALAKDKQLPYLPIYEPEFYNIPKATGYANAGLSKYKMIGNYAHVFGIPNGTKYLAQRFIYTDNDPTKYLKLYHFGDSLDDPEIVGGP